ncbi:MAG TPA: RlmE family RNA methyltransferase [Caulobacteraceae bacterium]
MVRPPGGGGPARPAPERLKSAKARSPSSRAWLERQIADPFAAEARAQGYRSRAALKLSEIDDRFGLIRRGVRAIDLGCAPGGWLQVATARGARVVGVDLLPTEPVAGAMILEGDFTDESCPARLIAALGGPPDLILSDMAPNTTSHRQTDHLRIVGLIEAGAAFALEALRPGGALLVKAFQGGETAVVVASLKAAFADVRHVKPKASRAESAELYLLARGFRGRG